jgi:hypothetical protein
VNLGEDVARFDPVASLLEADDADCVVVAFVLRDASGA